MMIWPNPILSIQQHSDGLSKPPPPSKQHMIFGSSHNSFKPKKITIYFKSLKCFQFQKFLCGEYIIKEEHLLYYSSCLLKLRVNLPNFLVKMISKNICEFVGF